MRALMAQRRPRRDEMTRTVLPSRARHHLPNSFSCWYCDIKIYAFNEWLFCFGWRYARFLKIWLAIGVGFSFVAFLGVIMTLLWELAGILHLHDGTFGLNNLLMSSFLGISPVCNWSLFLIDIGIMMFSTLFSVAVHEFGHAIAATSAGLQVEYIAIFFAILFPGALVAFNNDLLQSLPNFAQLRVYCAGIWHNAVFLWPSKSLEINLVINITVSLNPIRILIWLYFGYAVVFGLIAINILLATNFCSAVCWLLILLFPLILFPLYTHNEGPMVLGLPRRSPFSGYLSRGDVILSVDGANVRNSYDWKKIMTEANSKQLLIPYPMQNLHSADISQKKGYCFPHFWVEGSLKLQGVDDPLTCPDDLTAFVNLSYYDTYSLGKNGEHSEKSRTKTLYCLTTKGIGELKKCGNGWQMNDKSNCTCSQEESCMTPVQISGMPWVEISYSRPYLSECLKLRKQPSPIDFSGPESGSTSCGGTFVFAGDVLSMVYSLQLSSYRPRLAFMVFSVHIPVLLEKILVCTFHVSTALGFSNSLPVYFLDGESILEIGLCYIPWLNPRKRPQLLRLFLAGMALLSAIVLLRIFNVIHVTPTSPR